MDTKAPRGTSPCQEPESERVSLHSSAPACACPRSGPNVHGQLKSCIGSRSILRGAETQPCHVHYTLAFYRACLRRQASMVNRQAQTWVRSNADHARLKACAVNLFKNLWSFQLSTLHSSPCSSVSTRTPGYTMPHSPLTTRGQDPLPKGRACLGKALANKCTSRELLDRQTKHKTNSDTSATLVRKTVPWDLHMLWFRQIRSGHRKRCKSFSKDGSSQTKSSKQGISVYGQTVQAWAAA